MHALFVKNLDGNQIDWNLQKRFSIGDKLPPLTQKGKGMRYLEHFQRGASIGSTKKKLLTPQKRSFETLFI